MMMKHRLVLGVALAATVGYSPSAHAYAGATTCANKALKVSYSANYHLVRHQFGHRAPGRNIRKWGLASGRPSRCTHLRRSRDTLRRMREPHLAAIHLQTSSPYIPPAATRTLRMRPSSSGGLPSCTWAPESGGDYGAYNTSSGAYGRYQIIPSTWAAHCSDLDRGPSGQDRCAARVYAAQGSGAWVNC